jgi:hypothetical protein
MFNLSLFINPNKIFKLLLQNAIKSTLFLTTEILLKVQLTTK